jgi:hypothetical protein
MTHSESVKEIAAALNKAQGEMEGAKKDSENGHFKSKYADLASVWDAVRGPFSKHGLSVVQSPRLVMSQDGPVLVELETMVLHTSGEWMRDVLSVPVSKPDAHGVGSAITYGRRFSLSAFAGVAPEDDDANSAAGVGISDAPRSTSLPNGAGEVARVRVLGVLPKPTTTGGTKYVITASDRQTYSTIKKQLADDAKLAQQAGAEIELAWRQSNWGRDIVSIKELATVEPPL